MSPRAARLTGTTASQPFHWSPAAEGVTELLPLPTPIVRPLPIASEPVVRSESIEPIARVVDPALVERDAFEKGFAQGERSGAEAAARQGEAMLRRLAETINEVAALRTDLMRRAERELVRLALAIAERVIRREVALDRELLVAMARVAIDRLGERVSATIHLHPADHATLTAGQTPALPGPVQIVADPLIGRGGCRVHSDFGLIDLGLESQIAEMSRALLGPDGTDETAAEAGATIDLPDD